MIAILRHCLTATVSQVPLLRCYGLSSAIDFGHAISASLDLAGFEDACRLSAVLFRGQLGMLFVVTLASQQRQRVYWSMTSCVRASRVM